MEIGDTTAVLTLPCSSAAFVCFSSRYGSSACHTHQSYTSYDSYTHHALCTQTLFTQTADRPTGSNMCLSSRMKRQIWSMCTKGRHSHDASTAVTASSTPSSISDMTRARGRCQFPSERWESPGGPTRFAGASTNDEPFQVSES